MAEDDPAYRFGSQAYAKGSKASDSGDQAIPATGDGDLSRSVAGMAMAAFLAALASLVKPARGRERL